MLTFKLRESDLGILKQYLYDDELLYIFDNRLISMSTKRHYECFDKKLEVTLTIKESEKLLDFLSDVLMEHGFDEDGNLTNTGNSIENLIDIFNYYDLRE